VGYRQLLLLPTSPNWAEVMQCSYRWKYIMNGRNFRDLRPRIEKSKDPDGECEAHMKV